MCRFDTLGKLVIAQWPPYFQALPKSANPQFGQLGPLLSEIPGIRAMPEIKCSFFIDVFHNGVYEDEDDGDVDDNDGEDDDLGRAVAGEDEDLGRAVAGEDEDDLGRAVAEEEDDDLGRAVAEEDDDDLGRAVAGEDEEGHTGRRPLLGSRPRILAF